MASLSSHPSSSLFTIHRNLHTLTSSLRSASFFFEPQKPQSQLNLSNTTAVPKWRANVSFFPSFLKNRGKKSNEEIKQDLFEAIAPLDRGAESTPEDQERIDQIARKLEELNTIKEPLKSNMLNGKWELIYTTSASILKSQRPKIMRPNVKIYQAINVDTLSAQNMETWPFFNQATADLIPLNSRRVAVKFNTFKIADDKLICKSSIDGANKDNGNQRNQDIWKNLKIASRKLHIPIKAPDRPVEDLGQLEITYLDEEIRISRGNRGNLFVLKMADPSYRVPA